MQAKLWMFLFGIAMPFSWALQIESSAKPFSATVEFFKTIPTWTWVLLITTTMFVRALQVFVLAQWPVGDDGLFAYYSMELSQHWKWQFFFDQTQHPPLFNWVLVLFFKIIPPSLFSIRLFPALLSLVAFGISYFAARSYFSRSPSLVFCALCGISFWPLYAGRFCMYMSFLFLWELASLGALGWYLKTKPNQRTKPAFYLGLLIALGFWLAIAWPLVAFMLGLALFGEKMKRVSKEMAFLLLPPTISIALYSIVSITGENGHHINELWAFDPSFHLGKFLTDALSNITALFWGCDLQNSYGPVWGGMLNPLLGAAFFLGLLELLRSRKLPLAQWLLAGLFLFLTPGFLSKYFDIFRISPLLPLLLLVTMIGFAPLASSLSNQWRGLLLGVLFLVSTGLDTLHLWKTYDYPLVLAGSNISGQQEEFTKAYKFLNEINNKNGPGLFLLELQPGFEDQSLKIATYPFNAAYNPALDPRKATWTAVLCNVNYRPFLADRFPNGKWIWLGKDTAWTYGGLMLAYIPIDDSNRDELKGWMDFNEALKGITNLELNAHQQGTGAEVADRLRQVEPLAQGDPFLESCYAERILFHGKLAGIYDDPLPVIQRTIQQGYPTSVFFLAQGILLNARGETKQAELSLEKAIHAPLNLTPAEDNLRILESSDKKKEGR